MTNVQRVLSQYYKQVNPTFKNQSSIRNLEELDIEKVEQAFVEDGWIRPLKKFAKGGYVDRPPEIFTGSSIDCVFPIKSQHP